MSFWLYDSILTIRVYLSPFLVSHIFSDPSLYVIAHIADNGLAGGPQGD